MTDLSGRSHDRPHRFSILAPRKRRTAHTHPNDSRGPMPMNRTPRTPLRSIFLVAAIAAALPVACAQQPANPIAQPPAATPAPPLVSGLPDFTNLVQRVGPAVVNIRAEVTPR